MRYVTRILLLHAACNLVGIVDGLVYAWLAIRPTIGEADQRLVLAWAAATTLASYVLGGPVLFAIVRPVGRAMEGAEVDRVAAQRRALNLPSILSRAALWIWLVSAAMLAPLVSRFEFRPPEFLALHLALTTVLVGGVAATFTFYGVEWFVRSRVVPVLVPDGRVSGIPGVRPVPLRFRIVVVLATTCLLPVCVLTGAALLDAVTPATILYLGGIFLILGGVQTGFICRSVAAPIGRLGDEALRVRDGDLAARAEVSSADEIGRLAENFNEMTEGLRRAAFVRDTFGRYVSRQVLEEILNGKIALGGELRTATVLFSDIRGFTAASEHLPPAEVVRFLNQYLDLMVDVLVEHGGTIDKFMGDAIMASFGVPVCQEDDALRAVRCGIGMLDRLRRWNEERAAAGETPIEIGIGIHTGEVVAGNIGSNKKMEYTVIGDTVNTSSRIEQLNKDLGTRLLVSAETWALVAAHVQGRALPPVEVKGKRAPVQVYEVTGLAAGS